MRKCLYILFLLLFLPVCLVNADEPELNITGPESLYSRDYFELNLTADMQGMVSVTFTLAYDTDNLAFLGFGQVSQNGWHCETDRNRLIFTADPSKETDDLPTLKFRLRDIEVGTQFWVELADVTVQIGQTETQLGTLRWEQSVARPISADNYLSALKISDGVLSPTFSPTVQSYSTTVSYHIASVDVSAVARDPYAQVKINSPALTPDGVTNVTVTVMAEDGTERIYTIAVAREEDPNRPLSSECDLKSVVVQGFMLSPEFKPNVTEYVIWLPYEISSVDVDVVQKDERATVTIEGSNRLKVGQDNPITITCTAEDGTEKVYTIIAKRAEEYIPETTQIQTSSATAVTDSDTQPAESVQQGSQQTDAMDIGVPTWSYVVIAVAAITGAAAVGILISERKK